MPTNRHTNSRILYHGSYVRNEPEPNDLDLIIVYRPEEIPSSDVYEAFGDLLAELSSTYRLPIHPLFLTEGEFSRSRLKHLPELTENAPVSRVQLTSTSA